MAIFRLIHDGVALAATIDSQDTCVEMYMRPQVEMCAIALQVVDIVGGTEEVGPVWAPKVRKGSQLPRRHELFGQG